MKEVGPESGFAWLAGFAWVMCLSGFNAGKGNHPKRAKQKGMKHRKLGAFQDHWKGWKYKSGDSFGRMFGFKVTNAEVRKLPETVLPPLCLLHGHPACTCWWSWAAAATRVRVCLPGSTAAGREPLLLRFLIFTQEPLTAEPKLLPEPQPQGGLGRELLASQLRDTRRSLEEADGT